MRSCPKRSLHNYPPEKVMEVFKLYSEGGMRQEAIAERLGIDPSTVSKYIKAAKAEIEEITK